MIVAGCMRRLVVLVVLVVLIGAGWLFRDRLGIEWPGFGRRGEREAPATTQEAADMAYTKLAALADGSASRVALSAIELQSLLEFRHPGVLPAALGDPQLELTGDRIRLRARVPIDKLPNVEGLGEVAAFLPDTTELTVTGRLLPLVDGRVAFAVDDVSAQRFPLPRRLVPGVLERLGRREEPGLPDDAMAVTLPPGIANAYVRRDSLVLLARARAGDN
jgi:hypothetical protein